MMIDRRKGTIVNTIGKTDIIRGDRKRRTIEMLKGNINASLRMYFNIQIFRQIERILLS